MDDLNNLWTHTIAMPSQITTSHTMEVRFGKKQILRSAELIFNTIEIESSSSSNDIIFNAFSRVGRCPGIASPDNRNFLFSDTFPNLSRECIYLAQNVVGMPTWFTLIPAEWNLPSDQMEAGHDSDAAIYVQYTFHDLPDRRVV